MFKYLTCLLALLSAVLCPVASAYDMPARLTERLVLTEWVSDNAIVDLPAAKVSAIIAHVYRRAAESQLDPLLILSVMQIESGFKERSSSGGGAKGLMQVIPFWHRDKLKGRNPMNPAVSIEVGTQVLKDCWDKFTGNHLKTLSCYSGGGGKPYYKKVMSRRQAMRRAVIVSQFKNQEPLYAFSSAF